MIESIEPIEPVEANYQEILKKFYLANKIKLQATKEVKQFKEILDSYMKELPEDTVGKSYFTAGNLRMTRSPMGKVTSFKDNAEDFLKAKGIYNQFLTFEYNKEVMDELIDTGVVTQEEIEGIVDIVINYRTSVSEVKND